MKTKQATSLRQLKKLHKAWTSGALTATLEKHKAANNLKGVAKVEKQIAHAKEYDAKLKADAAHKVELDATRLERVAKKEAARAKAMGKKS